MLLDPRSKINHREDDIMLHLLDVTREALRRPWSEVLEWSVGVFDRISNGSLSWDDKLVIKTDCVRNMGHAHHNPRPNYGPAAPQVQAQSNSQYTPPNNNNTEPQQRRQPPQRPVPDNMPVPEYEYPCRGFNDGWCRITTCRHTNDIKNYFHGCTGCYTFDRSKQFHKVQFCPYGRTASYQAKN